MNTNTQFNLLNLLRNYSLTKAVHHLYVSIDDKYSIRERNISLNAVIESVNEWQSLYSSGNIIHTVPASETLKKHYDNELKKTLDDFKSEFYDNNGLFYHMVLALVLLDSNPTRPVANRTLEIFNELIGEYKV